jgi:arylsulfatase A-like enzyme
MKSHNKYILGLFVIVIGLLSNQWVIEKFLSDGNIQSIGFSLHILNLQFLLILYGLYLVIDKKDITINKNKIKILFIIFFIPFIAISIMNGRKIFNYVITYSKDHEVKTRFKLSAQLLDRVISFKSNQLAVLNEETAEILYSLHKNSIPLTLQIPENGVLDTAIGIDPLITNLFKGNVYFELSIIQNGNGKKSQTIFQKDIKLSSLSENEFRWQKVSIDLSKYSDKKITLIFNKGYKTDSQKKPITFYDLVPEDFMFWKAPNVRPKKLENKYNVILICIDTLRADHLHFMGYRRETSPNMDRLAQNGVYFTTVVSQSPWTIPSHFSIFTSTYPSTHRGNQPMQILNNRYWNDTLPTMASILRNKGFVTAAFTGNVYLAARYGFYKGFDFYNETYGTGKEGKSDVEPVFNKSMDWLNENKDRTFFLFIHTYEPHAPYCDDFFLRQEKINESETIKYRTAKYDGDIRRADLFVGKLIEKIDELGLTNNTLIIITSDHGEDLGGRNPKDAVLQYGHGHSLYDESLLVPLIFYNPTVFPMGKGIDYQVRLIDVLPTVLEYLGYSEKIDFQGKTLKGMIDGYDQLSRPAYSEATSLGTERESIRFNGYKYIYRISYGQLCHPVSWGLPLTPRHELYDLNVDPDEKVNIAARQKKIIEKYQKLILSIFPQKAFKDQREDPTIRSFYIKEDKELLNRLRSLGYIQ